MEQHSTFDCLGKLYRPPVCIGLGFDPNLWNIKDPPSNRHGRLKIHVISITIQANCKVDNTRAKHTWLHILSLTLGKVSVRHPYPCGSLRLFHYTLCFTSSFSTHCWFSLSPNLGGIGWCSALKARPVRAILQWPLCSCDGSVAGQRSSGVSAQRHGQQQTLAACQEALGTPVFSWESFLCGFQKPTWHWQYSHKHKQHWLKLHLSDSASPEQNLHKLCRTTYRSLIMEGVLYNRLKRHRCAPDHHVLFVCTCRLPVSVVTMTSGIRHTSVSLFRLSFIHSPRLDKISHLCVCLSLNQRLDGTTMA